MNKKELLLTVYKNKVYITAPHHIAAASFSTAAEREKAEKEPVSEGKKY